VMVEFLPTGPINVKSAVDTLWSETPPLWIFIIAVYLTIHVIGLATQEFYELFLNSVYTDSRGIYGIWEDSNMAKLHEQIQNPSAAQEEPQEEAPLEVPQILAEHGIKQFIGVLPPIPRSKVTDTLASYFSDVYNYVDITVIAIMFFYLVVYIIYNDDDILANFDPAAFDFYFSLIKTAEIFGFAGALIISLRLLSFTILFNSMNVFLLGLLLLLPVVGQFLMGFFVIIVSFAGGLNILYGSLSVLWSGGNEYMDSTQNALTGLNNRVDNFVFQPYVVYWLGDATLFVYLIICGIVLVNMLIAMMGSKFQDLTQKHLLLRKQLFAKGSALIELEHAILPAPLNIVHIIFLLITKPWWPHGEFDRWMFVVLRNPFIFTGQLRDMWCKFLAWKKNPHLFDDGEESEEEEQEEAADSTDEFFQEKDQYDVNASEDELNAYVSQLNKIKPFIDKYFARWHKNYVIAQITHRLRHSDDSDDTKVLSPKAHEEHKKEEKKKTRKEKRATKKKI